ncbi:unnamed protein product [Microthlaspi erraticum]|uniref:MULE transposase domain-containing protein n=1 Tax=Microthlaspi erraticum TaxID=1685480 RepID=A0A6D2IES8_9BRAS|nr:unnamed protein product [Microthlaspi erraticum]
MHYNVGEEFTDPAPNRCSGIDAGLPKIDEVIGLRKGLRMVDHYGYEDIGPIYNDMASDSLRLAEIDLTYEDGSIYIGRLFKNKEHFKITLAIHALKKMFRKANLKHTCDADSRRTFSKHASSKVIAALLRTKYETTVGPRPKDLPYSILREHHINASYWKCWKAKELAIASAHGTEESSYKLLPLYLYLLKCANPGSITHLHTEVDEKGATRFKYAFMALKACVDGWKHLRKILVVDGTHMFGKYRGCLLTASGQDANFQVFPIAFAVVDSENDLSCSWFFEKLGDIIDDSSELAIISDRSPSIKSAIRKWFPNSHHGTCLTHLTRNVDDHYHRRHQRALVQQAGEAFTVAKFKKYYVC